MRHLEKYLPKRLRGKRLPPVLLAVCVAASLPLSSEVQAYRQEKQAVARAVGATYWDQYAPGGWWVGFGFGILKMQRGGRPQIILSIAADTYNYNIRTSATASPSWDGTRAVDVILTVNSGFWVGMNAAVNAAIDTDTGWFTGTNLRLINDGTVAGWGGTGGASNGGNGAAGGDAIYMQYPLAIDNSGGYIKGGGGGGGGGGHLSDGLANANGGGGGGGQGNIGGTGGADSSGASGPTPGSRTSNGNGGPGGTDTFYSENAGPGGNGGLFGSSGNPGLGAIGGSGGSGGAAGRAVVSNGNTITWLGGNNGTQVVGAIV